jgi:hypothetical protein
MSKERLAALEQTGEHVFHGSSNGEIEILTLRQGTHIPDLTKPHESIRDGKPAVSATPYAGLATFRAIVNEDNIPLEEWNSGFGIKDGEQVFRVSSEEVLEHAKDKSGYVYVFDKKKFEPYSRDGHVRENSMEWRSYEPVKPIGIIKVTGEDLPDKEKIKIKKE